MLGHLAYGQLTQHNPTEFAAPHRLGLFASLTSPPNPNVTYIKYVVGGLKRFVNNIVLSYEFIIVKSSADHTISTQKMILILGISL